MVRDVRELLSLYPFLFEGLSDNEVEERLEFFRVYPRDPFEMLEQLVSDTEPRLSPEEAVYWEVVGVYQQALDACCNKKEEQVNVIRGKADQIADQLFEAARYGETRGQQQASLLFRYPELVPQFPGFRVRLDAEGDPLLDADGNPIPEVEEGVLVDAEGDPILHFDLSRMERYDRLTFPAANRAVRQYDRIYSELKSLLGNKDRTRRRSREISEELSMYFPELDSHPRIVAGGSDGLVSLAPSEAAIHVWAKRRCPHVGIQRAKDLLTEARKIVEGWEKEAGSLDRSTPEHGSR